MESFLSLETSQPGAGRRGQMLFITVDDRVLSQYFLRKKGRTRKRAWGDS
jgi:hypothetical protein